MKFGVFITIRTLWTFLDLSTSTKRPFKSPCNLFESVMIPEKSVRDTNDAPVESGSITAAGNDTCGSKGKNKRKKQTCDYVQNIGLTYV